MPPLDPETQGTELADLGAIHSPPPQYDNSTRPPHYDSGLDPPTPLPEYSLRTAFGGTALAGWVVRRLEKTPEPLKSWCVHVAQWCDGPHPPEINVITPFLATWQTLPLRLLGRLHIYARWAILFLALFIWAVAFGTIIKTTAEASASDYVDSTLYRLTCTNRLWQSPVECGLDGVACRPFFNRSMSFTCPAGCASARLLDPYTVGDQEIAFRPLVIGGTPEDNPVWRGDSFICAAAIQAGVISNKRGGCGILHVVGQRDSYGSIERNGIPSIQFNSTFPMSFGFDPGKLHWGICQDPRWKLLTLSTIFTVFFSLFASSSALFFVPIFIIAFYQVALASDPPGFYNYPQLTSTAAGRFLPAAFIAAAVYRFSVRKTLKNLNAQFEKTILWVGGLWVGALCNVTFDKIPIRRLHAADIRQQPNGLVALILIVLIVIAIILHQALCFRKEGRLLQYLKLYLTIALGLLILYAIPQENLRLHHYILALLLLPGTAIQTRPSLLYQGLLVGLFINGVARWDFASILETDGALTSRASAGDQTIHKAFNFSNSGANFGLWFGFDNWAGSNHLHIVTQKIPPDYDGLSVLVNDVERFRGFVNPDLKSAVLDNVTVNLTAGIPVFNWWRTNGTVPAGKAEFVRIGLLSYAGFGRPLNYGTFSKAGVWYDDGRWSGFPEGSTSGYID